MHVAFLIRDKDTLYGAEHATLDLASGLADSQKITVSATLICDLCGGTGPSQLARAFLDVGIPCQCIPARRGFSPSLVRSIRKHVASRNVDCVHAVGYQATVHGALAVRFGRVCPWVATVHGWLERPELKEQFYSWLDLQMLKRAQRVVVLSKFYRDKLARRGVPRERMTLIPSGVRLESLHVDRESIPFHSTGQPPTIGILGRLSSEKNHTMFLRTARRLLDDGCQARFLIAGDGPERSAIEQLTCRLNLTSVVKLAGVMDRNDFFRQVDLLALCSRIENLPYAILEAMAWSRPVVTTQVGGVADLVQPGVNGLLIEDQNVDGMATAIGQLLHDPPRARAMGRAGRQLLEQRFTLERSVEAHLTMYNDLTSSGKSARPSLCEGVG